MDALPCLDGDRQGAPTLDGCWAAAPDLQARFASDFLNQFVEAIALLDMLAEGDASALDDLGDWRPRSYAEHFSTSRLAEAPAVLGAWRATPEADRHRLAAQADALGSLLLASVPQLRSDAEQHDESHPPPTARALAEEARSRLAVLDAIVRAGRAPPSHRQISALFAQRSG